MLGVLPGTIGLIQATEALKLILGQGTSLVGRLLLFDSLKMEFKEVKIRKDPACALCGENPSVKELADYEAFCEVSPLEEQNKNFPEKDYEIEAPALAEILKSEKKRVLVDVREQNEWEICHIEGATLMPVGKFEQTLSQLNKNQAIYLYCYKGSRSMKALKMLHGAGFTKIKSLAGGIDHWAEVIDPTMPRY